MKYINNNLWYIFHFPKNTIELFSDLRFYKSRNKRPSIISIRDKLSSVKKNSIIMKGARNKNEMHLFVLIIWCIKQSKCDGYSTLIGNTTGKMLPHWTLLSLFT